MMFQILSIKGVQQKKHGNLFVIQGKHEEFYQGWNVATKP